MTVHSGDSEFFLPSILNVPRSEVLIFWLFLGIPICSCWLLIIYNYFLKKDSKSLCTFFFFLALRKRSKLNNNFKDNMEI